LTETQYQRKLIKKIERILPGCLVLKNDPAQRQGILDLTVIYLDRWAMLEVKISRTADIQPNQQYYVEMLDEWSFAAFIYPENEREVLRELQLAFQTGR
jgi:hypothetical protein